MSLYKSEIGEKIVLGTYDNILKKWPVDNRQYTIKTQYGKTFIIESGNKKKSPLLLIHGSVSNSFTWASDVKSLSEHFNVYAIDIIGEAGYSDDSRPQYDSGAYPIWINEIIDALGYEKVYIAGASLGGWIALSYATNYRDRVEKMVLLCPGGLYKQKTSFLFKVLPLRFLGKWGQNQISKIINGGKSLKTTEIGMKEALEYTGVISKYFKPRLDKLPIYSGDSLKRLTMPCLVMFGDQDNLLYAKESMEHIKAYARNVETETLVNTGHAISNQTNRIIDFLR